MPPPLTPVSPRLINVYRIRAIFVALVLLVPALVATFVLRDADVGAMTWLWVVPVALWLPISCYLVVIRPQRLACSWGWALDDVDLHVAGGLLVRTHSIVPLGRIQHIDVAQGPIERINAVATIVVHTAGSVSTAIALPGLDRDEGTALRDTIRSRMSDRDA